MVDLNQAKFRQPKDRNSNSGQNST